MYSPSLPLLFFALAYAQQFPSYQAYGEHHRRHPRVLGDTGERVDASELALVQRSEFFLQLTLGIGC
jgi:hypothetical protein